MIRPLLRRLLLTESVVLTVLLEHGAVEVGLVSAVVIRVQQAAHVAAVILLLITEQALS